MGIASSSSTMLIQSFYWCIDVIIDGIAITVSFIVTKMNIVYGFHYVGSLDNEVKRLVSVMWRCEIIPPEAKTRPKF